MVTSAVHLSKVEVIMKSYDDAGRIVREEWQHFYPQGTDAVIQGFSDKPKKSKK